MFKPFTMMDFISRHYIINFLWITVNIICIVLTIYHLVKLYKDYTNPSADTVRVATLVTSVVCTDTDASEVESSIYIYRTIRLQFSRGVPFFNPFFNFLKFRKGGWAKADAS